MTRTSQLSSYMEWMTEDEVVPLDEFREWVERRLVIDYDGYGHPVIDQTVFEEIDVYPSTFPEGLPEGTTHVIWFNR